MIAGPTKPLKESLCFLLLSTSVCAFQSSKLQVQIPQSLKKPGEGYDHQDAMFGVIPYGGSIQEQVYYAASTLCDSDVDKSIGFPSSPNGAWEVPFILMVDRGDCTFVRKVRNAQRAGASGVLIADDMCLCDRPQCQINEGDICESQEPLMGDDGSGSDISIPSFLIYKEDADAIKAELMKNTHVRVEMTFQIPAPDSRVEYELWMSPADQTSRAIERSFGPAAVALDKHAYFTPHMYVYDGIKAGCFDSDGDVNICGSLCTNAGRYCAMDPDDDVEFGASGGDVVVESLRRICIWQRYGRDDGVGEAWWKYAEEFSSTCNIQLNPDIPNQPILFNDEDCINAALRKAGIDRNAIDKCMSESGGVDSDTTNNLLQEEVELQLSLGVALIPSLIINDAVVRGTVTFPSTLRAICSGFAVGSKPDVCKECSDCSDEMACVQEGYCATKIITKGVPLAAFVGLFVGMLVSFIVVVYVIYKRMQRYMQEQIRGIVAEYMPVAAQNEKETTSLVEEPGFEDEPNHGQDGNESDN